MRTRQELQERIRSRQEEREEQRERDKRIGAEILQVETQLKKRALVEQVLRYVTISGTLLVPVSTTIASALSVDHLLVAWCGVVIAIVAGVPWSLRWLRSLYLRQSLEELRQRKKINLSFTVPLRGPSHLAQETYFNQLVKVNVENLGAYYSLVKAHTNYSFYTALVAGVIGFLLIAFGIWIGITNTANAPTIAYISGGSGVFTEFIAAIFFYLYNPRFSN